MKEGKSTNTVCYDMQTLYQLLPIGWNKLYELVNSRGFPKFVVGRRILIPKKQFEEWLESAATEQKIIC